MNNVHEIMTNYACMLIDIIKPPNSILPCWLYTYEAMDSTSKEACASVDTIMSGEGSSDRDSLDVLQGEKESLLSPLDVVSPRQRNRRTQALMSP